jgi:hypothetical protein
MLSMRTAVGVWCSLVCLTMEVIGVAASSEIKQVLIMPLQYFGRKGMISASSDVCPCPQHASMLYNTI